MKKSFIKRLSLVLLICMLFSILGTSCFGGNVDTPTGDIIDPPVNQKDTSGNVDNGGIMGTYQPPEGEYDIETPEGFKKLTLYWVWEGKTAISGFGMMT